MSYVLKSITIDAETGAVNVHHVEKATRSDGTPVVIDNHRCVIYPGDKTCIDPNDKQPKPISSVLGDCCAAVEAVWTDEVIAAYQALKAKQE